MIVVGLTGSIGMGKSTTAGLFAEQGCPVYDADAAVAALYEKGGAAVGPVEAAFPGVSTDGAIDRAKLRERVLGEPEQLRKLEATVYPLMARARTDFFAEAEAKGADIVILDIPLLFEKGGRRGMDYVVVVSAPADVQRQRVLERPDMTTETFEALHAQQMPDAAKRAQADFIVDTGHGLEAARTQVSDIVTDLRSRAKAAH